MPAPSRLLRAVSGALAMLTACLLPDLALAQLYSWKDADGHAIIKTYPPPWYKATDRSPGPRVQVLRAGKVIDDTAWPLERRQEGQNQSARQDALQAAPSSGLQAAPPAALQAARAAAAEQAARQAAEQAARKPDKN